MEGGSTLSVHSVNNFTPLAVLYVTLVCVSSWRMLCTGIYLILQSDVDYEACMFWLIPVVWSLCLLLKYAIVHISLLNII